MCGAIYSSSTTLHHQPPTRPSNIVLPPVLIPLAPQYLPLLFTALEREACPANRTSVVIALGDLAFRFPNALEPW